jgi:glycosyltransferase involved in cell wall biosynthesis
LAPEVIEFSGKAGDPRPAYCSADIFLLTSDFEGTPNVVLEAMACGLPVVAANVGDVSQLVMDGQTGFLVERDNEDELARRVLWLIENPPERRQFSRNARERVVQNFSENQLKENLLSIYEKFLNTNIESTPR